MKIKVARSELAKLRRRMKRAFPKERIEYLFGHVHGEVIHIHIFDHIPHVATKSWCEVSEHDHVASVEACVDAGFMFLGTIHSHPGWRDATPSETDQTNNIGELVQGIMALWKDKSGRLCSRTKWWIPTLPMETIQT